MPLYNKLIEEEERPLGTKEFGVADTLESVGSFISDQYKRIPKETRTELRRQLSIGLQPERWPDGTEKPNTLKILGNVYDKTIQPVKDEFSRATGISPREIDAIEFTADLLSVGVPLSRKGIGSLNKMVTEVIDKRIANPFKAAQMAGDVGTGFDYHPRPQWESKPDIDDPRTRWPKKLTDEEIRLDLDQFADAALIPDGSDTTNPLVYKPEVKVSPRGVPIAKRKEAGYKFLGDFAKEWNAWSTDGQFIDELADAAGTAFVEHLVGKGDRLNWFWDLPDHVRFRKGSRHGPDNVRLFYSDRQKKLKDATENILYRMQEGMNPMDRLIVEYDVPRMKGRSITVRQPSGDVILRKVDGTVVGRIGDFYDVLYAPTEDLIKGLTTNINPRTGTFYIDPNTRDMKRAIQGWREDIIRNKLNNIIDEAPNIEGKSASTVYQEQVGKIIDEEMAAFRKEYDFIPKPKGSTLDADMAATSFEGPPPDLPLLNDLLSMKPKPEVKEFLTKNPEGLKMLIDSLNGMDWRQLRSNYKHRYKRGKLEKVKSQLTSAQVQRIKQEYKQGGKAGYLSDLNKKIQGNLPSKTAERKIRQSKLKGYINIDDIFPD